MFGPTPTVTLVRLPLEEEFGSTHAHPPNLSCHWMYRGLSAIDAGSCLKFIKVDRHDGVPYGPLKDSAGFTITCHNYVQKLRLFDSPALIKIHASSDVHSLS
jgi:hypothetical protein